MKQLFSILLFLCSSILFAQNWSPVLVNEKMNYQHSDSTYISNTIWVDSAKVAGNDSIFYFNRIVTDHPTNPEMVLRNQPQFLLKQMTRMDSGVYFFSDPGSFIIQSLSNFGDIWTFSPANEIQAEVTETLVEEIFGIQDSIKIISLSDGNEFHLSKSFGIFHFPDFENGGYYELVGIQNTEYGESVPDFWDIYDFEVGDVFQYSKNIFDVYGEGWITRKLTITSKEIVEDTTKYSYDGIYYVFWIDYNPKGDSGYYISGTLTFINSTSHPANHFQRQIELLQDWGSGYGTEQYFTFAYISKDTNTNLVSKKFGLDYYDLYNFNGNAFYELGYNSDTLYRYEQISLIDVPCGLKGYGYTHTLGSIFKINGCFEQWDNMNLEGYIKNGDTVGTITPDSLLVVGVESPNYFETSTFAVFPNPASDIITIKKLNPNKSKSFDIEIRNLQGILIREEKNINSEEFVLDVGELPAGLYLYTIKNEKQVVQQGKLTIQ